MKKKKKRKAFVPKAKTLAEGFERVAAEDERRHSYADRLVRELREEREKK